MTDLTITKATLQNIADTASRHMKELVEDVMQEFSDNSPETAYPLAVAYILAITLNTTHGASRQNLVKLVNGVIGGCGFVLTPVQQDYDA